MSSCTKKLPEFQILQIGYLSRHWNFKKKQLEFLELGMELEFPFQWGYQEAEPKLVFPTKKRAVPQLWGTSNGTFQTKKVGEIDISFVEYPGSKSVQLTPDKVE